MLILDPINWDGDDIDLACGTINGIAQTFSFSGINGKIPFESTNFNTTIQAVVEFKLRTAIPSHEMEPERVSMLLFGKFG